MTDKDDIIIKTPKQIENIRTSGKYLTELLYLIYSKAKAGISLIELEFVAEHFVDQHHLKWAFKWYKWFPANLCLSVNECVVHGIPDRYILKTWDLLKIDCGIVYEKWISDSAISMIIGGEAANPLWYELIKATKEGLDHAIQRVKPHGYIVEYSQAINDFIKNKWFSLIEKLTGHGVGVRVHERPYIYNYPHKDTKKIQFESGMVLAFEPITAVTSTDFVTKPHSEWNLYCKNGDLGAHREYTIVITDTGYEILSGIIEDLWF